MAAVLLGLSNHDVLCPYLPKAMPVARSPTAPKEIGEVGCMI